MKHQTLSTLDLIALETQEIPVNNIPNQSIYHKKINKR
ncbi:hypothetical protein Pedsa_1765 [Pseudopedobacter saltans DSM 12145]|uniref:Uncharacterized protein n=1 Tax=Pseudopedobacter saltans (strain ATCC 51119 / DSM 12145 / JCM 21818 / CCUG 39354 / LMG 10337 / NBRC 100064 / NCIMB 13643) TaxID=762903 RepID=F0S859_PSESL|nr:hypothetical protein Pedsa_1765 [Pseudopedobacter saltans DSM 12145]